MALLCSVGVALAICGLLLLGMIPGPLANRQPRWMGRMIMVCSGVLLAALLACAWQRAATGAVEATWLRIGSTSPWQLGLTLDPVALMMAGLIGLLGGVIARYSQTYLAGDPRQGEFFRWMACTLGATLLLVTADNLVMLALAWMLTSFGLHQLLTYYPDRSWAVWAARKKFLISRLGDVLLVSGLCLTWICFGTTEFRELFAAAEAIAAGQAPAHAGITWIGILLVSGAMTKSAQFPFHTWLPDTMETPTPVSALMHAGVINAGGFLIIRLSPVICLSPLSLDLLALVGTITALTASVVMLTQTSVKRSLAYSTIAQMGFMMLQCGLGAFSAAMLHLVAHSAYKAHAFLSCGSVLDAAAGRIAKSCVPASARRSVVAFAGALMLAGVIVLGAGLVTGMSAASKPGAAVLGLVLWLALTQFLWSGFCAGNRRLMVRSLGQAVLISASYAAAYYVVDRLVAPSVSRQLPALSVMHVVVLFAVTGGFLAVFALQSLESSLWRPGWMKALYVHAMNGFYLDIPARRLTAWFYRQSAPVQ